MSRGKGHRHERHTCWLLYWRSLRDSVRHGVQEGGGPSWGAWSGRSGPQCWAPPRSEHFRSERLSVFLSFKTLSWGALEQGALVSQEGECGQVGARGRRRRLWSGELGAVAGGDLMLILAEGTKNRGAQLRGKPWRWGGGLACCHEPRGTRLDRLQGAASAEVTVGQEEGGYQGPQIEE